MSWYNGIYLKFVEDQFIVCIPELKFTFISFQSLETPNENSYKISYTPSNLKFPIPIGDFFWGY